MTTEDRVSFEIAKLLKIKRFPQHTKETNFVGPKYSPDGVFTSAPFADGYAAPHIWDVLKWLREKHNIIITIDYDEYEIIDSEHTMIGYGYSVQKKEFPSRYESIGNEVYDTFEEACVAGIKDVLENIIK